MFEEWASIPESYQEYIETIYRLELKKKKSTNGSVSNNEISQYLEIKPSSVTNMLRKLANKKLIKWKPRSKNIQLSVQGKKIAKKIVYNHLIMELFLTNVLGIEDYNSAHKFACELEHHMKKPIFNAFKKVIGKKNILKIEKFIEKELDPELIHSERIEILPTPEKVLLKFTNQLIDQIPEAKNIIHAKMKKFLEEY